MERLASTIRVDSHFHVFEAGKGIPGARYVPAYAASLDHWWRLANAAGVTHGVLVQPSFLGTDNQLLLSSLKAYPGRLMGVAVVRPDINRHTLDSMHAAGVRGVRLNLAGVAYDMTEWARATSLWDSLLELDWHVELHTDPGGLPHVLTALPAGLRIVVDHMGKPVAARADDPTISLLRSRAPGQVCVKLSGAYRLGGLDPRQVARTLLEELGPSALLWGSDWPCTNHEACAAYDRLLAGLAQWIGTEHLDNVLRVNPMQLYWRAPATDSGRP